MNEPWHFYAMSAFYIIAGITHFIKPKWYVGVIPKFLPSRKTLVLGSGVIEILLGVGLLFDETREISLIGIILMLALFLVVHVHMLNDEKILSKFPKWLLIVRIPLQFVLMYWAYSYL
ncbi:hypothetical protein Q2T40_07430 [Winogradskyella maritima]|uniref:DoxX-like protein n=1 Tax=Winogradskyella maritima TaxID=1517766 RepID=A0ABV8AJS8_9FLAO|nr:hypothetical protein [Winogradskyella maritima]